MSNVTLTPNPAAAAASGNAPGNYPSSGFLYATEFSSSFVDARSGTDAPRAPALANQQIAFGAINVASLAFGRDTRIVRLHATAPCLVIFGGGNAAAGMRLAAGFSENYAVQSADTVSVIASI